MNEPLKFVQTADGSKTIFSPAFGEHYHSCYGALQESTHVFLNSGLCYLLAKNIFKAVNVLEVGFGTGLNFLLSADFCTKNKISLNYTGIEAFPLSPEMIGKTGYGEYISAELWDAFLKNYQASLKQGVYVNTSCLLQTANCKLLDFNSNLQFDVLYFDAFASAYQPEMWTDESLSHACGFLKPGGVFVTYAITGNLKRSMKALGFTLEKAPGAPGKREMLRAVKVG